MYSNIDYGTSTVVARDLYDANVANETYHRVGANINSNGIAHEVLFKNQYNANPINIVNGRKAYLTNSTTAVRDDVIIKQAGKVVGRYQLKDTTSASGINNTIKQVTNGKYKGTNLIGTKETTSLYTNKTSNISGITQKMSSSNISSESTARIGSKFSTNPTAVNIINNAGKSASIAGAAISCVVEVGRSGNDWVNGQISDSEFTHNVVRETVSGGASGYAAGAAGTAVTSAVAGSVIAGSAPILIPAAAGLITAVAVGSAVKSVFDGLFS